MGCERHCYMWTASLVRTITGDYRRPVLPLSCTLLFLDRGTLLLCVADDLQTQSHTNTYINLQIPSRTHWAGIYQSCHRLDSTIYETRPLRRAVFLEAKSKENGPIYLLFTVFHSPIERRAVSICHVNSILRAHSHWCRNGWCDRRPSGTRTPSNHYSEVPTPHRHHSLVI